MAEQFQPNVVRTALNVESSKLVGKQNDPLIPTARDIFRVFFEGERAWTIVVSEALLLPRDSLPLGFSDLSRMLKHVPSLPDRIIGGLRGQPIWRIPGVEDSEDEQDFPNLSDTEVHNESKKECQLSFLNPIRCKITTEEDSRKPCAAPGSKTYNSLMLLSFCWAYILSVRLLELRGKMPRYNSRVIQPITPAEVNSFPGAVNIHLPNPASRKLTKWICALLTPRSGWEANEGGYPPWATTLPGDVRFTVSSEVPVAFSRGDRPPDSIEAIELLIELCNLFGLVKDERTVGGESEPLDPVTAAFLAVLALPFARSIGLHPVFPVPSFRQPTNMTSSHRRSAPVIDIAKDLRYFMTISMHPQSVGSIVYSMFWQPEIPCNLVSPWLGSILHVLGPYLNKIDLDTLAKVFAIRRPRAAPWWLGILLLGDSGVVRKIRRYLGTTREWPPSPPDTTVAAWTGVNQSFLDEKPSRAYPSGNCHVLSEDLLRHRYNLQLRDNQKHSKLFPWLPFGSVPKEDVEAELQPWLEERFTRTYWGWIWWGLDAQGNMTQSIERGFARDTGRFAQDVPERLETPSRCIPRWDVSFPLDPSWTATYCMLMALGTDMKGTVDPNSPLLADFQDHEWVKAEDSDDDDDDKGSQGGGGE